MCLGVFPGRNACFSFRLISMLPLVIVQARTGSTRLPNKMLMPFHDGESVLRILLRRLVEAKANLRVADVVVATTSNPKDDAIVALCDSLGVKTYRGSESDVLQRFIDAAKFFHATEIIRVCADNVFLDVEALGVLARMLETSELDYVSFRTSEGKPSILTHYGFWAEGVKLSALEKAARMTDESLYHEHVTNYIYNSRELFRIALSPIEEAVPGIEAHPDLRLTMDTMDDFLTQQIIYKALSERGQALTPRNIIAFLDSERPDLYETMRNNIMKNTK